MRSVFIIKDCPQSKRPVQNIGKGWDTILLKTHLFISQSQSTSQTRGASNATLVFVLPPHHFVADVPTPGAIIKCWQL